MLRGKFSGWAHRVPMRAICVALPCHALPAVSATAAHRSPGYVPTRCDSVSEDHFGMRIADPYRWLEQLESHETLDWVNAQCRLTSAELGRLPERETIRRRLTTLWNYSRTEVPWREAGLLCFVENSSFSTSRRSMHSSRWTTGPG